MIKILEDVQTAFWPQPGATAPILGSAAHYSVNYSKCGATAPLQWCRGAVLWEKYFIMFLDSFLGPIEP